MTANPKLLMSVPALLVAAAMSIQTTGTLDETVLDDPEVHASVDATTLSPIVAAPEYVYPVSLQEMLANPEGIDYRTWYQLDYASDLHTLAETVRIRQQLERIADALEAQNFWADR